MGSNSLTVPGSSSSSSFAMRPLECDRTGAAHDRPRQARRWTPIIRTKGVEVDGRPAYRLYARSGEARPMRTIEKFWAAFGCTCGPARRRPCAGRRPRPRRRAIGRGRGDVRLLAAAGPASAKRSPAPGATSAARAAARLSHGAEFGRRASPQGSAARVVTFDRNGLIVLAVSGPRAGQTFAVSGGCYRLWFQYGGTERLAGPARRRAGEHARRIVQAFEGGDMRLRPGRATTARPSRPRRGRRQAQPAPAVASTEATDAAGRLRGSRPPATA